MFVPVYNVDTSETSARVFPILLDASGIEPVKIYLAVWQKNVALIANETLQSRLEKAEPAYFVSVLKWSNLLVRFFSIVSYFISYF